MASHRKWFVLQEGQDGRQWSGCPYQQPVTAVSPHPPPLPPCAPHPQHLAQVSGVREGEINHSRQTYHWHLKC